MMKASETEHADEGGEELLFFLDQLGLPRDQYNHCLLQEPQNSLYRKSRALA
jgi:hypothetical protein